MNPFESYKNQYQQLLGRVSQLDDNIKAEEAEVKELTARATAIDNIQLLIQETAQETQNKLKYHIEDLVQTALDSCWPGIYDFFVEFEIKRGKTEARMYLEKDGEEIDPMEGTGGGVVDITAFALRLVSWSLSRTAPLLIMDEPMKWLSRDLRPLAGDMLRSLSEKLGLQIIMVTHDEEIINISDKVFRVSQLKGVSRIEVQ
jgi:DNA repair exonuclease SbcCD ATPase subunit